MAKASKESEEVSELLFELLMTYKRRIHAAGREHGLSPPQIGTLWYLERDRGLSMSALAELLMCDASNVTGIVDNLERRGLAKREQAADDRRVKELLLTEAGASLRDEIRAELLTPPRWVQSLTRAAQRELRDTLRLALESSREDIERSDT